MWQDTILKVEPPSSGVNLGVVGNQRPISKIQQPEKPRLHVHTMDKECYSS